MRKHKFPTLRINGTIMRSSTPKRDSSSDEALITDHEKYSDGDFEVISSDNIRFLVPSYYLFTAR